MSEQLSKPLGRGKLSSQATSAKTFDVNAVRRRRWPLYAGLTVLAVLALAYIDGGEEPLHPISQPVALPQGIASGQEGAL